MRGWSTVAGMALFAGVALGACVERPPCTASADCSSDAACSAGRCRPLVPESVPAATRRAVLLPDKVAAVYADDARAWPEAVVFGSSALGAATLYLSFPAGPPQRLAQAFLILEPIEPSAATSGVVTARASRVRETWEARELEPHGAPELALPEAKAVSPVSPAHALRLDVTELVHYWKGSPRHNHGLALTATTGGGSAMTYAARGARGPRLELYLH